MAVTIRVATHTIFEAPDNGIVIPVQQNFSYTTGLVSQAVAYVPHLQELAQQRDFTGKQGTILVAAAPVNGILRTIILVGVGTRADKPLAIESWRRLVGSVVRLAEQARLGSLAIALPDPFLYGATQEYISQQTTIILHVAAYRFDQFITEPERQLCKVKQATIVVASDEQRATEHGVTSGTIVGDAMNHTREWVNMPANKMTPIDLAGHALAIAQEYGLNCTIFDENKVKEMGMGGLAAVSSGSHVECRFVVLEYQCADKNAPTLCFVGKGITFDSGGLSIKPAAGMEAMKDDMSGAAAVIATMRALAQLKPNVNVVGIAPMSENLPSGFPTKPGDIVTFYNGKTAEIKNTDAEGRLILADALAYAVKHYTVDAIIDVATLTGACAYALGPFFTGMISEHDELVARIQESSARSGDAVWRLPITDDYKPVVKSVVADLCNIGKEAYRAGAITAACFLQAFVGDRPWVHLDIAGTAFNVPDISYYRPESATGVGVRLLIDLALHWRQ